MARYRASSSRWSLVAATTVSALLSACGGVTESSDLSPAAAEGRAIMRSKGCASCHGSDGGGGVGPALFDVIGSTVPLADGTSVTADRDYLVESITEPSAKIVEGYTLPMPKTDLSSEEIDAIIAYIEVLSPPTTATVAG